MSEKLPAKPNISTLLKPYLLPIYLLIFLAVTSSGLGLLFPKIIAHSIDAYVHHTFVLSTLVWQFGVVAVAVFVFTYLQNIVQTYTSERVARDLREKVADKISRQSYAYVEKVSQAKLLTNLTSDIDSVKLFVSQAIASLASSIIIVIGASILLLSINWKLALVVLLIVPIIGVLFFIVFGRVRVMMKKSREVIDWLNKVINESILGAALIRVLNSHRAEEEKFVAANTNAKSLAMGILKMFAFLIPVVTFVANIAVLAILVLGGHFVIGNSMSLGDFAAFNSYVALLVFPILIIGVMGNIIAQATASYERVAAVLETEEKKNDGKNMQALHGDVMLENIALQYGEKSVLKNISLRVAAGTRTAIIGPTGAGKSQLLYALIGLVEPTSGTVMYDGAPLSTYDVESVHQQIGFVFQDSSVFNLTLRENVVFSKTATDEDLAKALATAEMKDFVDSLPEGLDTVVSERGTTLSGGQRQRLMLARALALNPQVLLLDDFTARVDNQTEQKIIDNIARNYPGVTLISVTQKIGAVEKYDQIVLLMDGEIIAAGRHEDLLATCPEYVQIYDSQKSTNHYE